MLYEIKNKKHNDITIGIKTLKYNDVTIVQDLAPLQKLIDLNYIEIVNFIDTDKQNASCQNNIQTLSTPIKDFIDNEKKIKLTEGFFDFYLHKEISKENLDLLKWFYKKIGFTSGISQITLDLIDDINSQEELIEILLNNIYPELFDQYILQEKNK